MPPPSLAAAAIRTAAVLDLFVGDRPGPSFALSADRPTTIGRSGDAGITIGDRLVSRLHAEIRPDGSGWTIADLGSRNGTRVDGTPIAEAALHPGVVIGIGTHSLLFREPRPQPEPPAPDGWRARPVVPLPELVGSALGDPTGPAEQVTRFLAATRLLACRGPAEVGATLVELVVAHCAVDGAAWIPATVAAGPPIAEPAGSVLTGLLDEAVRQALLRCRGVVCLTPEHRSDPEDAGGDLLVLPIGTGPDALLVVRATESPLRRADLGFLAVLASLAGARRDPFPMPAAADTATLVEACPDLEIAAWERRLIDEALRRHGGNVGAAARAVGVSRATLYRRLGSPTGTDG